MTKPDNMVMKVFLDSGDQKETQEVIDLIGFLDGQTTNPSLVAKNPEIAKRLAAGEKLTEEEVLGLYKKTVEDVSSVIPDGSVSIEVIADLNTTSEAMVKQAHEMYSWIPNAHVKLPTTTAGLEAAEQLLKDDYRINFTLCFTQEQVAAIIKLCENTTAGQIFISPFIGRLDDKGENGMDFIKNCITMKKETGSNVEILAASVRTIDHFYASIAYGADIATVPMKILQEWKAQNLMIPSSNYTYMNTLSPIPYKTLDLTKPWREFDLSSELTTKGIEKFTADWNSLTH